MKYTEWKMALGEEITYCVYKTQQIVVYNSDGSETYRKDDNDWELFQESYMLPDIDDLIKQGTPIVVIDK